MSKVQLYYKELKNLTVDEIFVFGLTLGLQKPTHRQRKNDLLREILNKQSTFLDDTNKKFYFSKDESQLKFISSPVNPEKFEVKTIPQINQINIESLKQEIADKQQNSPPETSILIDEFDVDDDSISGRNNDTSQIDHLTKLLETTLTKKTKKSNETNFHFRQKLRYEPTFGIEAFIRSVEAYGSANDMEDKNKLVAIAKSALNQSEDGLLIQDSLLPAEDADWDLFKSKLLSILGRAPDYYRDFYRSFRRGTQNPGLAMSRLTQAYKRGFLTSGNELSESDKKHVQLQFIQSLDNPLRGLVKAEESRLNFSNIAERAAELERCFGSGMDSAAALMFPGQTVQLVSAISEQSTQETVQIKMIELLNTLTEQSKHQHAEMMRIVNTNKNNAENSHGNPGNRRHGRKDLSQIVSKLQGHCYQYVKYGNCRRDQCRYKHSDNIPEELKKIVA